MGFQRRNAALRAVAATLIVALLSACTGGGEVPQRGSFTSNSVQFSGATHKSVPAASKTQRLLYVADDVANVIDIFAAGIANPQLLGQLTKGVSTPYDVYVDDNDTLYVANRYPPSITEYAPGQTAPSATLFLDRSLLIDDVAVSPSGTIDVSAFRQAPAGEKPEILEFDKGAAAPSRTISLSTCSLNGSRVQIFVGGMTFDRQGDLLLDEGSTPEFGIGACGTGIFVYPQGSTVASGRVPFSPCELGGIERVDNKYGNLSLLVGDGLCSSIYALPLPVKSTKSVRVISSTATYRFALDRNSQMLYAVDGS
jgi:hypothetical protein